MATHMRKRQFDRLVFALPLAFSLFFASNVYAQERVTIQIRAFIPSEHLGNTGYVKRASNGLAVIPAPPMPLLTPTANKIVPKSVQAWALKNADNWKGAFLAGTLSNHCFSTDNRGFSLQRDVSARLHFEISLLIKDNEVSLEMPKGHAKPFWSDPTYMVDCISGDVLHSATSDPYQKNTPLHLGSSVGELRTNGDEVTLWIRGSAGNPLAPLLEAITPAVDFSGLITYNRKNKVIHFKGVTGVFPAIEAYVNINSAPPILLFKKDPLPNTDVWDLADMDTGINTQGVDAVVQLGQQAALSNSSVRPVIPTKTLQRSHFVASAMAIPGETNIDAVLLAKIADDAANVGKSSLEISRTVALAEEILNKQSADFAATGLDLGLDRASLIKRKLSRLRSSEEFKSNPIVIRLANQVGTWGNLTNANTATPSSLAADNFLRSSLEELGLRAQEKDQNAQLLPVLENKILFSLGVSPNQSLDQLSARLGSTTNDPAIRALSEIISKSKADDIGIVIDDTVVNAIGASVSANVRRLEKTAQDGLAALTGDGQLSENIEIQVLNQFNHATGMDAFRMRDSVMQIEANGLTISSAESGLYLASSLAGVIDKKLGSDIERFGSAAITLYKTANALGGSASLGNLALGLGTDAATGNYLGALMTVSGMFGGSNPLAPGGGQNSAVQAELASLRKQIEALAKNMNDRFDRVDKSLEKIYVDMDAGFTRVERRLAGVEAAVDQTNSAIALLNGRIDAFESLVLNGQRQLLTEMSAIETAGCIGWRSGIAKKLDENQFYNCAIQIAGFATRQSAQDLFAGSSTWDKDAPDLPLLLKSPTDNVRLFFSAASALGFDLVLRGELDTLVSPRYWGVAVTDYLKLLNDWQEYRLVKVNQINTMLASGNTINRGLVALGDAATGARLLSTVMGNYLNATIETQLAIESERKQFLGEAAPPLPSQNRNVCKKDYGINREYWTAGDLTFPMDSRLIPGMFRRAEIMGMGKVRVCIEAFEGAAGHPSQDAVVGQELGGSMTVDMVAYFDHVNPDIGSIEIWQATAGLPIAISATFKGWGNPEKTAWTSGINTDPAQMQQLGRGYWKIITDLLSNASTIPDKVTSDIRWPMQFSTALFEQDRLLDQLEQSLGMRFKRGVAYAEANDAPVIHLKTDQVSLNVLYNNRSDEHSQLFRAEMERLAAERILQGISTKTLASEALRNMSIYGRLYRGFVQLGFADELTRNDPLLALTRGERPLPDSDWIMPRPSFGVPVDAFGTTSLRRALALTKLIDKARAERQMMHDRVGNPSMEQLLSGLKKLRQEKLDQCEHDNNTSICSELH